MVFHFPFEAELIIAIQSVLKSYPFLIKLFSFLTILGEPAMVVLIFGFFYWGIDKKNGFLLGLDLIFIQIGNSMVKNIFTRIRPYAAEKGVECFWVPEKSYDLYDMNKQGYSFPSGHSANTAGLSTTLYQRYHNKKILYLTMTITVLVMLSRVALGVHYPSDVIGGALLGIGCVFFSIFLQKRLPLPYYLLVLLLIASCGVFFCRSNDFYSTFGLLSGMAATYFFERKYVNFENTANQFRIILRLLFGGIIFLSCAAALKLPFSTAFLEADVLPSLLYRSLRYGLSSFLALGVYPYFFRYNIFKLSDEAIKRRP